MLLHAREGHAEFLGKVSDRSVGTPELLQHATSGDVRERGERGIEAGLSILNHVAQYAARELSDARGGRARGACSTELPESRARTVRCARELPLGISPSHDRRPCGSALQQLSSIPLKLCGSEDPCGHRSRARAPVCCHDPYAEHVVLHAFTSVPSVVSCAFNWFTTTFVNYLRVVALVDLMATRK